MVRDPQEKSLRSSMISGSTWMVAMRWCMRGIGIVSTVILVRLLAPDDFGLVAMSSLFISFLTVLTAFGVDMALIQKADADAGHYDTAWTIRFLQTAVVAAAVYGLAGVAADYFQEERVTALMQLMSVGILVGGLENIGVVDFRKDLHFSREFTFMVATKLGSFVVTIALAVWLRNYWALAWGVVSLRVISVVMSFAMHPYRPKPSFSRFRELWDFSQWMLLRNIGMYFRKQIDTILIARFFNTGQVGFYSVAREVSELPTTELIWPMARALYPGYAKLSHDVSHLGAAFLKVLNTICLICLPTGIGLALVAEPLVVLAFGERWLPTVPVLTWLSIYGIVLTIASSVQSPLIALGRMRLVTAIVWAQLVVAVPAIWYAVRSGVLEYVALTQVGVTVLTLPLFFAAIVSVSAVRWADIGRAVVRPLGASLVMAAGVAALPDALPGGAPVELFVRAAAGVALFVAADLALWIGGGRPDGGELAVLEVLVPRMPFLKRIADS